MVALRIPGTPAPQGSKSAVVRGRKAVLIEGSSTTGRRKHRAWRTAVQAAALEQVPYHARITDPDVPVAVHIVFVMPRPKSRPLKLWWHTVKPDVDKLIRSTLDGLADGQALERDQQVSHVDAVKRYEDDRDGWTGAHVTIAALDHDNPPEQPDA